MSFKSVMANDVRDPELTSEYEPSDHMNFLLGTFRLKVLLLLDCGFNVRYISYGFTYHHRQAVLPVNHQLLCKVMTSDIKTCT